MNGSHRQPKASRPGPLLSDFDALDIAKDLYIAWPSDTPGTALRKFLCEVPLDWNQMPELA